jgi:hypothetical protein
MNGKQMLTAAIVAGVLMAAPATAAQTEDLWLHVRVHESQGDEKTTINLPLSLVQGLIALVPEGTRSSARIKVNDREVTVPELRAMWRDVRRRPDATWVTTDAEDGRVRVAKRGSYLYVQADERRDWRDRRRAGRDDQAEIRIPVTVVDALLSGKGDRFDLGAAISALARHGEGELVAVSSDDETVRIWVDGESVGR